MMCCVVTSRLHCELCGFYGNIRGEIGHRKYNIHVKCPVKIVPINVDENVAAMCMNIFFLFTWWVDGALLMVTFQMSNKYGLYIG